MTPQREIATKLLTEFPNAPTKTLAIMAYRDNKSVFKTVESARGILRTLRGASGSKKGSDLALHRAKQASGDPFGKIPLGKSHYEDWHAHKVDGPLKVLVLSDIHIPYHDKQAVVSALKWGKENGADAILLNGDTADFFSVSFWEKDPRKRRFADELNTTKDFLATARSMFPKARMIAKIGNHEERWERYMFVKAPELLGVKEFKIESILNLDGLGIECVSEKRPIRLGNLNALHGHEYRFAISNPVNPARGLFLRCKAHAICGHFHQSSYHSDKTVEQETIATWSTGCLCDLHPDYSPLNNWNHGFAFVEVFNDGKFTVKNCFISGGKVY